MSILKFIKSFFNEEPDNWVFMSFFSGQEQFDAHLTKKEAYRLLVTFKRNHQSVWIHAPQEHGFMIESKNGHAAVQQVV